MHWPRSTERGIKQAYWTMGHYDIVTVIEAPDDESVTAMMLELTAEGNIRTATLRDFDHDQMQAIVQRTGGGSTRPHRGLGFSRETRGPTLQETLSCLAQPRSATVLGLGYPSKTAAAALRAYTESAWTVALCGRGQASCTLLRHSFDKAGMHGEQ
ncbi:MAG TPA: GYD domain-containing protein [Rubrobacter sp.]